MRVPEKGNLIHYWWECKLVQPLWKAVWRFLKKLISKGIYPRNVSQDTIVSCTPIITEVLSIITKPLETAHIP
jgi:hypothetical protein